MYKFINKGQTLKDLKERVKIFDVPDLITFKVTDYNNNSALILKEIIEKFDKGEVAIRSSSGSEDNLDNSAAGKFNSVLGVPASGIEFLKKAINSVIMSYDEDNQASDQVIVQSMISDVSMSGVIFTHDLNTGAPYYVINYDDISGITDTVTSGGGEYSNRTLYVFRNSVESLKSERFSKLVAAVQELEEIVGSQFLDIEFAMTTDLSPMLLQVRPITTQPSWDKGIENKINQTLLESYLLLNDHFKPKENVYGRTTVLGQMPDWNPAEMIGRAPRKLSYTLYEKLITDSAWRIARKRMGYMVPLDKPLMHSIAGQPFIDTRCSFHSFLPNGLSPNVAEKLVNFWVANLIKNPEMHDKVEFDIAITTYSFDIDLKLEKLVGSCLNKSEKNHLKALLHRQTYKLIMDEGEGGITEALKDAEKLFKESSKDFINKSSFNISNVSSMIDSCINLGTIPFSILARHGFIAQTILHSLFHRNIFTKSEIGQIQSNVKTVASELVDDMHNVQKNKLSLEGFMDKYGHLRPGTYDILSKRYDQMDDLFQESEVNFNSDHKDDFEVSKSQLKKIDALLLSEGYGDINSKFLMKYIESSIKGREYGKFIFTRSVSNIIELIANFGKEYGFSRDEMSHIPIQKLSNLSSKQDILGVVEKLHSISEIERKKHKLSVAIRLPQILSDQQGVYVIPFQVSHPNFVTNKSITSHCIFLNTHNYESDFDGKIILIENADPGFDWIFSKSIAGLITKYGGVNSHMAIRCAEFSIPAAIGCGEQRFDGLLFANQISMNCQTGLINIIN